jgi:hypothetical protein
MFLYTFMNRKIFTFVLGTYVLVYMNYSVISTDDDSSDVPSLSTDDGWVPNSFPDPGKDQNDCRISNVTSVNAIGDCQPLLLCDPDSMVSQNGLKSIASSLHDFNVHNSRDGSSCPRLLQQRVQRTMWKDEYDKLYLHPQIGVAIVKKMDVKHIIHDFDYVYTFEDEDDIVNDSAEYFASFLHNAWFYRNSTDNNATITDSNDPCCGSDDIERCRVMNRVANGIVIFISIEDEVCFISIGSSLINILTWWRMESMILKMKDGLRQSETVDAVMMAINHIQTMMDQGPPSTSEKAIDFLYRFGVFILFAFTTFTMTIVGDRLERKRYYRDAEKLSQMGAIDTEKAKLLQQGFKTRACPICLEPFCADLDVDEKSSLNHVDSYGIPTKGSDGLHIKILRCGHIIDRTCWIAWISTGKGDIMRCPVCRQDIAKDMSGGLFDSSFYDNVDRSRRRFYGSARAEEGTSSVSDEREIQEERLLNASFLLS